MLRAVILDMDGTLLDTEIVHYYVIRRILARELGYDPSMTEYLKYCGIPDPVMWPMILEELDSSAVLSLAQKWGIEAEESAIDTDIDNYQKVRSVIFQVYQGNRHIDAVERQCAERTHHR